MAKEKTKTQKVRRPEIKASYELWARFEEWMRVQSCSTLANGLLAAMKQVTNFGSQSPAKIT